MNAEARRAGRLLELSKLVGRLGTQGKTPEEIIKAVRERAYDMASPSVAENYVQEIIRRFSK